MRSHRITDEHAEALLNGHALEDREDLRQVAGVVGALRLASFEAPPQPSAALAARLDLDRLAWVSAAQGTGVPGCDTERMTVLARRPAKGKIKTALGWFAGLGLAAQLVLGAGAVSASAAGIGMAGVLPPAAQEVFDAVVATVANADETLGEAFGNTGTDGGPQQGADDARTGVEGGGSGSDTSRGNGGADGNAGDAPNGAGRPDGSDSAGNDHGNGNGKPESDKSENAEKSGKADNTGKPDHAGKPEQAGKPDNGVKPEKADGGKQVEGGSATVPGSEDAGDTSSAGKNQDRTGSTVSDAQSGGPTAPNAGADEDKGKAAKG